MPRENIPTYEQLLPESRKMVQELGIYRDKIQTVTENSPKERIDHRL